MRRLAAILLILLLLAGCGAESPAAEEEPTPLPTEEPVRFLDLGGESVPIDVEALAPAGVTAEELLEAAPLFTALRSLDLRGCAFENEELLRLREACPQAEITANISLYGQEFTTNVTELDFSGTPLEDAGELEALLPLLPELEKVIMSDCGIGNEEMDALNRRHENVRFVWTIYFGRAYYLRTDETAFIASLFQGKQSNYSNLRDEDVEVLKYCEDMVALDLGHMSFTNCEFVRNMPHLRYLILADTPVQDISPLAGLEELWYLELFNCRLNEIAPLLECPSLRHLNLCYLDVHDAELLAEMTELERLWYMSPYISREEYDWLLTILPDTEKQLGMTGSSTGGGWRSHPAYFEMRDAFGAFYIP
ncbi:MAG: hypothetical protein IJE26_02485 [Oscillospiraceae bacterium]|nr:hypothetical protein [Oscillospiraceae bacterium]